MDLKAQPCFFLQAVELTCCGSPIFFQNLEVLKLFFGFSSSDLEDDSFDIGYTYSLVGHGTFQYPPL